jgi:hypothetical protein
MSAKANPMAEETSSALEISPSTTTNQPARLEDLTLFKSRLPVLDIQAAMNLGAGGIRHSEDRTTKLVKKWRDLSAELKTVGMQTLQFCEAKRGREDTIFLVVVDKELFDIHQDIIADYTNQLAKAEAAIRKLDAKGTRYYQDVLSQVQIFGSTEDNEHARIASMTSAYIQRNRDMDPAKVLELPEVVALRKEMEATIEASAQKLKVLRPQLKQMDEILSSADV